MKGLELLLHKSDYVTFFKTFGKTWELPGDKSSEMEEFVCDLYGDKLQSVDELRYSIYCAQNGKINYQDALEQHTFRACN